VRDPRIDQIQDHLYNGLAIMDLVGHIDELHTLWRRDSVAYAMRLAFREWQAADALLSDLAEDRHGTCGGGRRIPGPTPPPAHIPRPAHVIPSPPPAPAM
jgi:hypothetical protein